MGTRIKDIARRANVSEATVSLVLNQKPGVSTLTRERILKFARDMGYGAAQRHVLSTRSGTIRFLKIATHGHTVNRDHDVFIGDYIDGLTRGARTLGYNMEISAFRGAAMEEIVATVRGASLKGIIVLGTELGADDVRRFSQLSMPFVVLDTYYDFLPVDFVDMNNKDAVHNIISHLVKHGHTDLGFVRSTVNTHNFFLRDEGFYQTMTELEMPIAEHNIFSVDSTFDGAYRDMLSMLGNRREMPTALFCTNDIMAYGTIKALREKGWVVPDDISVIGFDDLPLSAVMDPPLTTMQVSKKKMGEMAVQLISMRIENEEKGPPIKIQVGGQLVVRSSVRDLKNAN
ncbi:MAG: LacI family DNA-binding transcriptional regulator [Spirochaetaceae bacterium]